METKSLNENAATAGSSTILFGDQVRQFKFTLKAARLFRARTGIPLWKVRRPAEEERGPAVPLLITDTEILTATVWAGLLHDDRTLTFEAAEDLLQMHAGDGFEKVYAALARAFHESGLYGLDMTPPKAARVKHAGRAIPNA